MGKVIMLNQENEESFIAILKNDRKVNVWCTEEVRARITDKDFGKIINFAINELSPVKGYRVGEIFVEHIDEPVIVSFCVDEEDCLNIDSINFF